VKWCYEGRSLEKSSVGTKFVDITGTGPPHHAVLVLDFRDQGERGSNSVYDKEGVTVAEVGEEEEEKEEEEEEEKE